MFGIRLHPAGRDLACKPSPSNPTREVRRDFTPLENENAPRGAFELLAERVGHIVKVQIVLFTTVILA